MVQSHSIQRNGATSYATTGHVSNKQFDCIDPVFMDFQEVLPGRENGAAAMT
jgi:hypothetical protein